MSGSGEHSKCLCDFKAVHLEHCDIELFALHDQVYLEKKDGCGCIFKILPRYKVQSVGEEVHYSDQVKFESVATEGQYLHCSCKTFGQVEKNVNINKNWSEF